MQNTIWIPSTMLTSRKKKTQFQENFRTEGRTDRNHRILLATAVGPIRE